MTVSRRLLLHVTLGTAFVVAVVTAVTYTLVFESLKKRELQILETYVRERAKREELRFQRVEVNLRLVRGQFLARLAQPMPPDFLEKWDYWYRRYPDGAWRSREQFKDARRYSSMWAHKDWPGTPQMRREVLIAQELCDEMLPGWVDAFPSYYFQFRGPLNVGVDTAIPLWAWEMPADYDAASTEWMQAALPKEKDPPDRCTWTGLQKDPATPETLVCVYLPVVRDGELLGSVGHNMSMESTLDGATHSEIPGASHFIFRGDGRLIAHPTKRSEILASQGLLTAEASGDPAAASLHRLATASSIRQFSGFEKTTGTYYSIARLAGPDWYYVTAMPQAYLQSQAAASAQWVLWSGMLSLALVVASIAAILREQIARPLAELTRATRALSAGESGHLPPTRRADELGELASSFREMIGKVAAREADLRQLNLELEQRVAEQTGDLRIALARERELGEMKSRFVSLVSHEFRTPLGVIMSAVDVLQRYFDRLTPEKRARHLQMIFNSTRNLAGLIEEVLLLGRVEEGRMQFTPAPVDAEKLLRSLADEVLSATGGACPIGVHVLDALDGAVSDEGVLRHIVSNLLSNAVKYSEPGEPVDFIIGRDTGNLVLTVRDHGIGIPEADQERLFTSFSRGSNVGQRPGTGLGLVVVHRCATLHGGSVRLESTVGIGTQVIVTLPVFSQPI